MNKIAIASNRVAKPFGIFSQAVKAGTLIFVSGQVAKDTSGEVVGKGDINAQTKQCLENLKHVLEAGGATLEDVVKLTVYVANMEHLSTIHEVRAEYFKEPYPASTLIEVSRFTHPEYLIEIEAVAVT
jgi:2-iminobutanoate/2-iminopropanoate deaminase